MGQKIACYALTNGQIGTKKGVPVTVATMQWSTVQYVRIVSAWFMRERACDCSRASTVVLVLGLNRGKEA